MKLWQFFTSLFLQTCDIVSTLCFNSSKPGCSLCWKPYCWHSTAADHLLLRDRHLQWYLVWKDTLCEQLGVTPELPRRCGRQQHRSNVLVSTPQEYYFRTVTLPFLGRYQGLLSVSLSSAINRIINCLLQDHLIVLFLGFRLYWTHTV